MATIEQLRTERARINGEALDRVVEFFGDRAKMARALGLSRSYTAIWTEVPVTHVRTIECITKKSARSILPDPYPYPSEEIYEKAQELQSRKAASR